MRGLVVRSQSGFYIVHTEQGNYVCQLRGKLKKGPRLGDLVAIGDWVQITIITSSQATIPLEGIIESVESRSRVLARQDPTPRGIYQQILTANLDQAVLVFACSDPAPRFGMLDRFLVIAEKQGIPVLIIANKTDLLPAEEANNLFGHCPQLGYPVIYTSTYNMTGIEELRTHLANKVSVLLGPSGVGKTSLLNAIQPDLGLEVRSISQTTNKGRHTTVIRQLFALQFGGYLADTPGLKALALWDIQPEEIDGYFPEMRNLVANCVYNDCRHIDEPGCAIQQAVTDGQIHPLRYRSYLHLRFGVE